MPAMDTGIEGQKKQTITRCSHVLDVDNGRKGGRKSLSWVETSDAGATVALLGAAVMAADMPHSMQVHAFRCARRAYDGLDKFSSRQVAQDVKKEFDEAYGPTWHCIVGMSFGSFVTHQKNT